MGNGSADEEWGRGVAYGKWKCRWGRESWNGLWEMKVPMRNGVVNGLWEMEVPMENRVVEWLMKNRNGDKKE